MSLAAESLWDPQQREWLEAMGHSLLVLAADAPDAAETVRSDRIAEIAEAGPTRAADVRAQPMVPVREPDAVEPPARARRVAPSPMLDEPVVRPSPARSRTDPAAKLAALTTARRAGAAGNASGPLGEALLRATGQSPAAAARTLRELLVDQSALRDEPGAKRALWARLRSLRKAAAK